MDTYIVVLRNLAGRGLVCTYDLTSAREIIFLYCCVFNRLSQCTLTVPPCFSCIGSFVVTTFLFLVVFVHVSS